MKLVCDTGSHFDLDEEFANRLMNEVLARPLFGHLATGSEQGPRESPVWFLWEDGILWIIGNYETDSFQKELSESRCAIGIVNFEVSTGLVQHVGFREQAHLEAHDTERMKRLLGRVWVYLILDTIFVLLAFAGDENDGLEANGCWECGDRRGVVHAHLYDHGSRQRYQGRHQPQQIRSRRSRELCSGVHDPTWVLCVGLWLIIRHARRQR